VVARELRTGELRRVWLTDNPPSSPPYDTGVDSLFVAYYASAELVCHLSLDWAIPLRICDLYTEFRCLTNGLPTPCGSGLLGALAYYGLDALDAAEKETMRGLALRGGRYSRDEREALLAYCQTDVDALARLFSVMLPRIDLPRALLRGRYMAAAARIEWIGVPIDVRTLTRLRNCWGRIKERIVGAVDKDYGVFVSTKQSMRFSSERWEQYLACKGIPWPLLPTGKLALDDDTFREMARAHPAEVGPIRELRYTLSQLRLNELAVGKDGRNRVLLSAFRARTGRNAPSNSRFIFGPSTWLRSLIKPGPGRAIAYCDWSAQELGIAARLSGDKVMQEAYQSGDPYLFLARKAGAVPPHATKKTHAAEREQFKTVSLGVLYGLSADGLARKLDVPPCRGRELLQMHQETFRTFWSWSNQIEAEGMLTGRLQTVFGWTLHVGPGVNPRSLRNFPMQSHGSEMLRLACCLATERGIPVCAPIHDATLTEGPTSEIKDIVAGMKEVMGEASELVLPGFPLRSEAKIIRYPSRYSDPRGERMWRIISGLLEDLDKLPTPCTAAGGTPCSGAALPPAAVHPPPILISYFLVFFIVFTAYASRPVRSSNSSIFEKPGLSLRWTGPEKAASPQTRSGISEGSHSLGLVDPGRPAIRQGSSCSRLVVETSRLPQESNRSVLPRACGRNAHASRHCEAGFTETGFCRVDIDQVSTRPRARSDPA
jgi:hypothetical protein